MHFNLTFGENNQDKCAKCGSKPMLVTFSSQVETHPQGDSEIEQTMHEISEEVSGHYCEKCCTMIAIFMNT